MKGNSRKKVYLVSGKRYENNFIESFKNEFGFFKGTSSSITEYYKKMADSDPKNAAAQETLYSRLVTENPNELISRYESEKFAFNENCTNYYVLALQETNSIRKLGSIVHNHKLNTGKESSMKGTSENPILVKVMKDKRRFDLYGIATLVVVGYLVYDTFYGSNFSVSKVIEPFDPKSALASGSLVNVTFDDVRGCDEAKAELVEVVDFLKNPEKYQKLNAKMPRGLLLIGPPGTGKTLLAKAIAGEAQVPFYFSTGSEFDEVFVGVGMRRIKKLFENARKSSPSIIFIDEIDALAGKRNPRDSAHHRACLNQLLSEMDGFNDNSNVLVIAATNLPGIKTLDLLDSSSLDSLDDAVLRPGRFDKRVHVSLPDVKGRKSIFDLYLRNTPLYADVSVDLLARVTPGFSGADIASLVNQAKINASLENSKSVKMKHLERAKDDWMMGRERKSVVISDESKKLTAYHEGGHAIVTVYTKGTMELHKATIIPRGSALGYVSRVPREEEYQTKDKLLADLDICMAGRAAEELIFGSNNVTPGAYNDFQQATSMAKRMVQLYGMSSIGQISVSGDDKISESLQTQIDNEVSKILKDSADRAKKILENHRKELELLAGALLEHETLSKEEIENVIKFKSQK